VFVGRNMTTTEPQPNGKMCSSSDRTRTNRAATGKQLPVRGFAEKKRTGKSPLPSSSQGSVSRTLGQAMFSAFLWVEKFFLTEREKTLFSTAVFSRQNNRYLYQSTGQGEHPWHADETLSVRRGGRVLMVGARPMTPPTSWGGGTVGTRA